MPVTGWVLTATEKNPVRVPIIDGDRSHGALQNGAQMWGRNGAGFLTLTAGPEVLYQNK